MNLVQNFRNRRKLHKIKSDGTIEPVSVDVGDEQVGALSVGLGGVVSTVSGQGRLGVGIYVYGSELRLAIGQHIVNLLDAGVLATRATTLPFLWQFEIVRGSERVISIRYWWIDLFEDPFYGTKDILKFICELSGSRERALRFYFVWQATKNGDDVTSATVRTSIEEAVAKVIR